MPRLPLKIAEVCLVPKATFEQRELLRAELFDYVEKVDSLAANRLASKSCCGYAEVQGIQNLLKTAVDATFF